MQEIRVNKENNTIAPMFDSIAARYDFLNHFLSFGIDRSWRRKTVATIADSNNRQKILDVATGTADLAIAAAKLNPLSITGIDISDRMLEAGRRKIENAGLTHLIKLIKCESENLCFEDNTFDVAMVAFGVRNFTDPLKGLSEMRRVVCEGGLIVVLEFSRPAGFMFKNVYNFYFRNLLPMIGGMVSKDGKAYRYLYDSVIKFADNKEFIMFMESAGISDIRQKRLTGGIASIYSGLK